MPRQFKAGVKHKAIVEPADKIAREIISMAFSANNKLPISFHSSFEKALETVNKLRMSEKARGNKSRSTTLLQTWYNRFF
jgi:hypothetical protein